MLQSFQCVIKRLGVTMLVGPIIHALRSYRLAYNVARNMQWRFFSSNPYKQSYGSGIEYKQPDRTLQHHHATCHLRCLPAIGEANRPTLSTLAGRVDTIYMTGQTPN